MKHYVVPVVSPFPIWRYWQIKTDPDEYRWCADRFQYRRFKTKEEADAFMDQYA